MHQPFQDRRRAEEEGRGECKRQRRDEACVDVQECTFPPLFHFFSIRILAHHLLILGCAEQTFEDPTKKVTTPRIHAMVYDISTGYLKRLKVDFREYIDEELHDIYDLYSPEVDSLESEGDGDDESQTISEGKNESEGESEKELVAVGESGSRSSSWLKKIFSR